ncbi:hypothetical protein ACTNDP_21865 [Paenibacillus barengoltzii]|uniref:hypothetical protein n=1 Tax=Paenibacillus barengoltzii TaxID=343517 RepID=UPI003F8B6583
MYQNYLASFQTMIPELQSEMEYARAYSQFVKGLTEEESRNLFGPMLTQEMDAEQTIQTAEAALGQLDYLYRLKLQYLQYPKELSGEELQEAIHEHGFTGAEGEASLQSDEKSVALPASEPASQDPGGIPWGRMLGWTIIGSVLGWLGKKTLDRLRAVVAKKLVESVKNASPEERKAMLKNYQQGTKTRSQVNTEALKTVDKISPVTRAVKFIGEKIGRRVPMAATLYTAYDTYQTITDPELEQQEKWKQTTAIVWKGAWAIVGGAVGTLAGPGYGSVVGGFVGYTFGELTSSWAEKAGENLFHIFH